jgi:hypothetical protein
MDTLRLGSKGEFVENWQYFLLGLDLYAGAVDGDFGPRTQASTKDFQRRQGLRDDGIAGNQTLGRAMTLGFAVVGDSLIGVNSLEYPHPPDFKPLGVAGRNAIFGSFPFVAAPIAGNPENITVSGDWRAKNIVTVHIPQLAGVKGATLSGKVEFHKLAAPRVQLLFKRWEDAGLLPLIVSYGGSYVPRFVRGSRTTLSPHAHGSAFDINVTWNGFGAVPARSGGQGSVRKLVPIANELGFYWGGHFTRKDGMHFEVAKLP